MVHAQPGDLVELHLGKVIYEGTLLESPEGEGPITLLKLGNGYNVGFPSQDVQKTVVLQPAVEKKASVTLPSDKKKKNIALVITGGTIAARSNPKKGGVDWLDTPESLFSYYPELFSLVNVSVVSVPFMKASEDMDFHDWGKIARVVQELHDREDIEGVVVTHGTDFLHYTSAALSYFLQDLSKPIVLTYSQRSIDRASSDARLNLLCSARVAISDIAEVILVGHATQEDTYCFALPGTKVKKMHTSRRDAFQAVNAQPFAKITPEAFEPLSSFRVRPDVPSKLVVRTTFEEKVALVKVYPGQDPTILDWYSEKGYRGVVLELSGLGHGPTMRARLGWTAKIREIISKGVIVCATPQTVYGRLDPYVYSNGRELLKAGVIYLDDMLSETAFVKLGWLLGNKQLSGKPELVREKMLTPIAGDIRAFRSR